MTSYRKSPIEIEKEDFLKSGYHLIDTIAELFDTMNQRKITTGLKPPEVRKLLGGSSIPEKGESLSETLNFITELLITHSLYNGHPKFMGFVTSSPAPVGALADLLAAAINANVGANMISPVATEIEKQAVGWLADFINLPKGWGGIFVSGGTMANFTAFLAAREAKSPGNLKKNGLKDDGAGMTIYCSEATHAWMDKAAILFGHGLNAIRYIPVESDNRMNTEILELEIRKDIEAGKKPFFVNANAGDVSTGVVDNMKAIALICKKYNLWFHIDGAYGIPAAAVPELKPLFDGINEADSIAIDPHKWLYAPLEAGCTLIKNPQHLMDTFSLHPEYYHFGSDEEQSMNFYEFGLQNSRGFRGLKVWMALKQVGRQGYTDMIREDIDISKYLFEMADTHPEMEALTHNLSITTFRYVPRNFEQEGDEREKYLNVLNETLLDKLQVGGEVFLSNAVINDKFCLRSCIVNFRTSKKDIEETVDIIVKNGRRIHEKLVQEIS